MFHFVTSNLDNLLSSYGYLAVFLFVGIESIGIPFPGETMLVTAGIYAGTTHRLSIVFIIVAAAAGAIVGDNIGYVIGRVGGYRLLRRYGKYIRLEEPRLKLGQYLFRKHGSKVVFFGRFVSILRTFAAFLAGVNLMPWRRFLFYNAAGGILWSTFYGVASYQLGSKITTLSKPVDFVLIVVGALAVVGAVVFLRINEERLTREAERAMPGPLEDYRTEAGRTAR
ncbi:MAG: DedA family protein [Candidatus Dormibacteraeota bacterium]|nr:DedA family protein [Candidatus Dormibacteraeota bacterium]